MHLAIFLKGTTIALRGDAPDTTCGANYSFAYQVVGGTGPYTFSISEGGLPPGLSINPATGQISGTVICEAGTPLVFSGDCPDAEEAVPYSYTYTLSGGTPPRTVSVIAGSLPTGITISNSGVLSGTVPGGTSTGVYEFTLRAADSAGRTVDVVDSMAVGAYLTTEVYPLDVLDGMDSGGSLLEARNKTQPQYDTEAMDITASIVAGVLRDLFAGYDTEALDITAPIQTMALRDQFFGYDTEALDSTASVVSGTLRDITVEVDYDTEALDITASITQGTLL